MRQSQQFHHPGLLSFSIVDQVLWINTPRRKECTTPQGHELEQEAHRDTVGDEETREAYSFDPFDP
jgi:hypothetical protein